MLNEINRSEVRTNLLGWICVSLYFLPKIEECASLPPLDNPTAFFSHELDNSSSMRSD
jgi:hypothetical protein